MNRIILPLPTSNAFGLPSVTPPMAVQRPTQKDLQSGMTNEELFRIGFVPAVMMELVWDYVDTLCDISTSMRIPELKKLTRVIRNLRQEYITSERNYITEEQRESERDNMEGFQEFFFDTFDAIYKAAKTEIEQRYGKVEPESLSLAATSVVARICYRALLRYAKYADDLIERKYGKARHSIIPGIMHRLGSTLHCFAGDLDIELNTMAWRSRVAKLEKLMHRIEFQ